MFFLLIIYHSKSFADFSVTILAIARELVAAGDGAFLTCSILEANGPVPESKTKSSTNEPSVAKAWALTPAGPLFG